MLEKFLRFIHSKKLVSSLEKTLIATSAGLDSVVLCHLFLQAKLPFGIAHCNFNLRGKESDEDEIFVKKLARQFEVPYFTVGFSTEKVAKEKKQSIQVAARELRYKWLEEMRRQKNFQHIATAHHLNDSIETVLYNFAKGCGIRGLHGILPQQGKVIRPLLFATKDEISNFAKNHQIAFREDSSNFSDKYARNQIRHQVVPVLRKLNPNLEKSAAETITHLKETEAIFDFGIEVLKKNIVEDKGKEYLINILALRASPALATVLFEILKPFQFNNHQVIQILQSIENQPGSQFYSPSHQLLIDREILILKKREKPNKASFFIEKFPASIDLKDGSILLLKRTQKPKSFSNKPSIAFLDLEKLSFPLQVRHWQSGDFFCPQGMKGKRQKLQDFFSNLKLSRFEKERIWLLLSGEEICWVVGHRIGEDFKITAETKDCLQIELKTFAGSSQ